MLGIEQDADGIMGNLGKPEGISPQSTLLSGASNRYKKEVLR